MIGCLAQLLSHLALCVLICILTGSFIIGGIIFFLPFIYLIIYFATHKEEFFLIIRNTWPFIVAVVISILLAVISSWYRADMEKDEKAMRMYYGTEYTEWELKECRNKLPVERYLDRSTFHSAMEEMKGMDGQQIIGHLEYGMSPREMFDAGDSLTTLQREDFSSEKFYPYKKVKPMFNEAQCLYGVQLEYFTVWGDEEKWDAEVENMLRGMIDRLKQKYGNPTIDYRGPTDCHVKWNYGNQVIHWHTEKDGESYQSTLYIYLPWAYNEALKVPGYKS